MLLRAAPGNADTEPATGESSIVTKLGVPDGSSCASLPP